MATSQPEESCLVELPALREWSLVINTTRGSLDLARLPYLLLRDSSSPLFPLHQTNAHSIQQSGGYVRFLASSRMEHLSK